MCEVLDRIENRGIAIGEKRGISIGEKRGISIGEKRGISIGEKRGLEKMSHLTAILLEQNRLDDLRRAVTDPGYQNRLMDEFDINNDIDF